MIKYLKILSIMLFAALTVTSCGGDDEKGSPKILTVKVASQLKTIGTGSSSKSCMDITVEETGAKLYLQPGEILGFAYKEGFEYRLRIKEIHVGDKDGNEIEVYYELETILSETKVEEETPIGPIPT